MYTFTKMHATVQLPLVAYYDSESILEATSGKGKLLNHYNYSAMF